MGHSEVECVNAPKIVGVQRVLTSDLRRRLGVEILREDGDDRVKDRDAGYAECLAVFFEMPSDVGIYEGEKNDARLLFNFAECPIQLGRCSDQRIDVRDWPEIGILRCGSFCYCIEGFTGRVGNQMEMVEAL